MAKFVVVKMRWCNRKVVVLNVTNVRMNWNNRKTKQNGCIAN